MASSIDVANQIIKYASEKGITVTPMKLIKLVYLSHGWMMALRNRQLIDENVQAWQYGPVIPELYNSVKKYRDQPVVEPLTKGIFSSVTEPQLDEDEKAVINAVFDTYGEYSGIYLSNLTHQENSPWDITWRQLGKNAVISNDLIQEHYAEIYHERTEATA